MSQFSELEGAALGVVWRNGPCSAYAVKQVFEKSRSATWSASAGAIYPLLAKLERDGHVETERRPWGNGHKTLYVASVAGEAALISWLVELDPRVGTLAPDPIRTRLFFIDALPDRGARLSFLDEAETHSRAALLTLNATLDERESDAERMGTLGSIMMLRARIRWLRLARRHFAAAAAAGEAKASPSAPGSA